MRFDETVTDASELRELVGEPMKRAIEKELDRLNERCRDFIARSPFLLISSSNAKGHMDVSPKGDPPGFVRVLDDSTIVIPDRPGNRRVDTYSNILENPNVGLIFLVPGENETLRVSGTAQIVRDSALRESMSVKGKAPNFALAVTVREAFFHCPKCMIRSQFWQAGDWAERELERAVERLEPGYLY